MTGVTSGLRGLLGRLVTYRVDWHSEPEVSEGYVAGSDRFRAQSLADANAVSSELAEFYLKPQATRGLFDPDLEPQRHVVALDIDHPVHVVESSTPGHFHLYIDVPGGVEHQTYMGLLDALAEAGVIEEGYAAASKERGATYLRLPWVKKGDDERPTLQCFKCGKRPSELTEYRVAAMKDDHFEPSSLEIDNYVWREEGTLDRKTGLFACTACYVAIGQPVHPRGWKPPVPVQRIF